MKEGYRYMKNDLEQIRDIGRRQLEIIGFMIKRLEEENNPSKGEENGTERKQNIPDRQTWQRPG